MEEIKVLDHGYVKHIESWGTGLDGKPRNVFHSTTNVDYECGIIEAARQSTQGSFRGWERDEKLLEYMYNHKHSTPFEFAGMVIEVQAPIFVFREWHRHRTQSYNEMSARYAPLPDLNYIPTKKRCFPTQEKNIQAKAVEGINLTPKNVDEFLESVADIYYQAQCVYERALKQGIPKELARIILPVGRYSRMRASANLRNWLAFMTLRQHPDAQFEIRQYANAVNDIVKEQFSRTWKLFEDGK